MANIGDMTVNLSLDSSEFKRELDKVKIGLLRVRLLAGMAQGLAAIAGWELGKFVFGLMLN